MSRAAQENLKVKRAQNLFCLFSSLRHHFVMSYIVLSYMCLIIKPKGRGGKYRGSRGAKPTADGNLKGGGVDFPTPPESWWSTLSYHYSGRH